VTINPAKEGLQYVDAIQEDVKWLGYKWMTLLAHQTGFQ
jgi:glutamyl/glutaminyl-tRNA synthetase